eukprot:22463_1
MRVLDNVNIYIAPTINVDGYLFAWSENRNWRKNRRHNGVTYGVDINRNYDGPIGTWCSAGASTNPASDSYCGPSAFSEPETVATANFMNDSSHNIGATFDIHTSGQYIMYPWAYTPTSLPDADRQRFSDLGQAQSDAVFAVNGYRYNSIQCAPTFLAAGSSIDFAWSQLGAMGFGYEGRGPGFSPPPSNIITG